jgi:hypothetical protein
MSTSVRSRTRIAEHIPISVLDRSRSAAPAGEITRALHPGAFRPNLFAAIKSP